MQHSSYISVRVSDASAFQSGFTRGYIRISECAGVLLKTQDLAKMIGAHNLYCRVVNLYYTSVLTSAPVQRDLLVVGNTAVDVASVHCWIGIFATVQDHLLHPNWGFAAHTSQGPLNSNHEHLNPISRRGGPAKAYQ